MGLFDGLAKKALGKIIDQVEDKIESATGLDVDLDNSGNRQASPSPSSPTHSYNTPVSEADVGQKFDTIFADHFSNLQISKETAPQNLGFAAAAPCRPYSYALSSGGKTVAVVMLTPHNRYQNRAFNNAKEAAKQAGVPFLNFFTHFENEPGYVINRIRGAI